MSLEMDDDAGDCKQCGHPFNPHSLVPTDELQNPLMGGVILCQVRGCMCFNTFAVPGYSTREDVVVPDEAKLAWMRAEIQD